MKLIPVTTPKGTFRVWIKRIGNNSAVRVLLLHGGPGATHEYLEAFDSYFPAAGFEYYYYDKLGSFYSDQPNEPDLWDLPRFVEEVEQVRLALGLTREPQPCLLTAAHRQVDLLISSVESLTAAAALLDYARSWRRTVATGGRRDSLERRGNPVPPRDTWKPARARLATGSFHLVPVNNAVERWAPRVRSAE